MATKPKRDLPSLWERQEGESGPAWEAFRTYRDLGETRTLTAVANELHKSYTLVRRWRREHDWDERTLAYDNELQKEELKRAKKERREMNARHINLSMHLQKAVADALKAKDFTDMSDKDIASFVRVAVELERLARADSIADLEKSERGDSENCGKMTLADSIIAAYENNRGGGE